MVPPFTGLSANSFMFYFTGRPALLFTFPSRYLFTIGLKLYLALEDDRIPNGLCQVAPPDSHRILDRGTQEIPKGQFGFEYETFTLFGQPFHVVLLAL